MSQALRIRVYNVLFGDAVLVSAPDRDDQGAPRMRHILFDVGNVLAGAGGSNEVYGSIFEDILRELGGAPLDLYVMTHEHLDHVEGPLFAHNKGWPVRAANIWMTASAEGDAYYERHPDARRQKKRFDDAFEAIRPLAAADASERFRTMLMNNDPMGVAGRTGTQACVAHIRDQMKAEGGAVHFVDREFDVETANPFQDVSFRLLAPERDTSTYYGRPRPFTIADALPTDLTQAAEVTRPPPGVDAGAYYDLIRSRQRAYPETLLAIDKAANNTSIVLEMSWRGRRLLFAGDAEIASWRKMAELDLLRPVDFLKIGHHGSHNGTPLDRLDLLFPADGDPNERHVAVSTCCGAYGGVPHDLTLNALGARARLYDTRDHQPGAFFDVLIDPKA